MRKEIDSGQLSVFVFIAVMAFKIFMAPGLLIKYSGRDGWISMLFYVVIELIILLIILQIIKLNPDKTFYELLADSLGKTISGVVLALFIALLMIKLIIMCGELKLFFNTSILKSVNFAVCFAVLLVMLVTFVSKGLTAIGRMTQIFFPFILAALLVLFLLTVGNLNLNGLAPVEVNLSELMGTMSKFPMWFGDVAVLLIFTGKVKFKNKFVVKGMLTACVSSAIVMYFAIVLFAAYGDYPIIIDYGHNISNMVVYSSGSYLFGRFDIPIFCIWMISIFVQITVNFYAITSFAHSIAQKGNGVVWAIATAIALFILSQFVFNGKSELFELGTGIARWLCLMVEALLPTFALVISITKRRKKNDLSKEKSDN